MTDGEERYLEDCPEGVDPDIAAAGAMAIMGTPDVHPALTEWTGFAGGTDATLVAQVAAAERAIAVIEVELGDGS